jgi:hypothetical protein
MANRIIIKTSAKTPLLTPDMNVLVTGEFGYTYADGDSDGGDRLFIGAGGNKKTGTKTANEVHIIGGKYYTDMMNHKQGNLVANSAILTDADGKVNQFKTDTLILGDDTLAATGQLNLDPANQIISAEQSWIKNLLDPVDPQDAVTKRYIDTLKVFSVDADADFAPGTTGNIITGERLQLLGGFNLNTIVQDQLDGAKTTIHMDSDVSGLRSIEIGNVRIEGNTLSTTAGGDLIIDPTPAGNAGKVIIKGDFQVDGSTTTINSTTLTIEDKNIVLAKGAENPSDADSAGICIDGVDACIFYKADGDHWFFNKKIVAPNINIEGNVEAGSFTGRYLGFDSDFARKSTTDLTEGTNLYYTRARWDSAFSTVTTDGLTEGTNKYYTVQRVWDVLSAVDAGGDGSFSYDSSKGQFTYTGPSPAEVRSHFSAGGDLVYDSALGRFSIDVEVVYTRDNFDSDLSDTSTDVLPEGTTNKYYTTERFDSDFGAKSTDSLPEGNNNLYYTQGRFDSALGDKTTDNVTEGITNLYYTTERFDTRLSAKTTDDVAEGATNLYFTGERVDDRVYQLLHAGEGIDLNYTDAANELIISTELASALNPGVATFDSVDFLVTAGNVEINVIDCGTY